MRFAGLRPGRNVLLGEALSLRRAQRPKPGLAAYLLHVEPVPAKAPDVLRPRQREPHEVLFANLDALTGKPVCGSLYVQGVPHDDRVRKEAQAERLVGESVLAFLTDRAALPEEEKAAQLVQGFSFVELRVDAPPERLALQIAKDLTYSSWPLSPPSYRRSHLLRLPDAGQDEHA